MKRWWISAAAAAAVALLELPMAWGDHIKLSDGTEFSATVVDRDPDSVVIRVPREQVATIDGAALPPPVKVGMAAPKFSAVDLSGVTRSLEPGQVTLLQFWASWCPYCRKDSDLMKQLPARYGDRGLRILTVSIDEDLGKLKSFMDEKKLPYPVISVSAAPDLPAIYEARGVPGYYLIDRDGAIAGVWRGSVTHGLPEGQQTELEKKLDALLPPAGA